MNEWHCYELDGFPIHEVPDNISREEIAEKLPTFVGKNTRITNLHGLRDGMRVIVRGLIGWKS